MKKKGLYSYELSDGRMALSPTPLDFALDNKHNLQMDQLGEKERHDLSILADPLIAHLLTVASDGQEWLNPERVMAMSKKERLETSFYRHHCLIKDGTIYVHDGQYIPLVTYLRKASHEELIHCLWNVAFQAALAQLENGVKTNKDGNA